MASGSNWGISYKDLCAFRLEVESSIIESRIVPTDSDSFDPKDRKYGPSIYTVCQQLVMPTIAQGGHTSWALMLHPTSLECDLFVSHAWQEGVFELIDKVLASWPWGARHAYICVLSNPQNDNISSLLEQPLITSPFAQALSSASWVLVVPNRNASIYSRIWCTYEVYLAYKWRKQIFTASPPIEKQWLHVLPIILVFSLAALAAYVFFNAIEYSKETRIAINQFSFGVLLFFLFVSVTIEHDFLTRSAIYVALIAHAINRGLNFCGELNGWSFVMTANRPVAILAWRIAIVAWAVEILLVCAASELDIQFRSLERRESEDLRQGYSGQVMDATCSFSRDGERIKNAIRSSGEVLSVDRAVEVLIKAGMSTPALQEAESCGIDTSGAAHCGYSKLTLMFVLMFHIGSFNLTRDSSLTWNLESIASALTIVEGFLFVSILITQPRDGRRFSARAAIMFHLPAVTFALLALITRRFHILNGMMAFYAVPFISMPLTLITSLLGASGLIRVPMVGIPLTRLTFYGFTYYLMRSPIRCA